MGMKMTQKLAVTVILLLAAVYDHSSSSHQTEIEVLTGAGRWQQRSSD
jgi:hypothetical protein